MNYIIRYFYDNYNDDYYQCKPRIQNGSVIELQDCKVQFYTVGDPMVVYWINGESYSKEEAISLANFASKILTYMFALPYYEKSNVINISETSQSISKNSLASKRTLSKIDFIDSKIRRFSKTRPFFNSMLDLLTVSYDNLYKCRDEDAFIYFFKVIEQIVKQYYQFYLRRFHTISVKRKNKAVIKDFINYYSMDNMDVHLTDDMLNVKVDLLYNEVFKELYGSVFGKISLFVTKNNISFDINLISKIVKIRNKIAHGDMVDSDSLSLMLLYCEKLSLQIFSKFFFNVDYQDLHIPAYRLPIKVDLY